MENNFKEIPLTITDCRAMSLPVAYIEDNQLVINLNAVVKPIVDMVQKAVSETISKCFKKQQTLENEGDKWLTREEVMNEYHISASTLHRRQRDKIIMPKKFGKKCYYCKKEIEQAINGILND